MSPRMTNQTMRVWLSTASVAVLAVGLVPVPPARSDVPIEIHQVQLSASVLSAAVQNSAFEVNPSAGLESSPDIDTRPQETALVAAAEDGSILDSPIGPVLALANFVLLPVWFLFTPFTLPLSMLAAAALVPDGVSDSLGGLLLLAGAGIIFLTGPLGVVNAFLKGFASTASVSASASSRADTAEATPVLPSGDTPNAEEPAGSVELTADVNRDDSALKRARDRSAARQIGATPRPAAVTEAATSSSNDAGAAADGAVEPDATAGAADVPDGKSKARARSHR